VVPGSVPSGEKILYQQVKGRGAIPQEKEEDVHLSTQRIIIKEEPPPERSEWSVDRKKDFSLSGLFHT